MALWLLGRHADQHACHFGLGTLRVYVWCGMGKGERTADAKALGLWNSLASDKLRAVARSGLMAGQRPQLVAV
jgi:hypothetical protein